MHDLAPLIFDLTVMLCIAGIVTLLFQRIKQPVVLGYLVSGMIIGPYTPPHGLITQVENIKILSELGVIFLMFSLGLEFSFHKLTKVGLSALVTGIIDVSVMLLLGYSAGKLMGWDQFNSIFLGAALAISSTTIIFKAVDELNLKTRRFAEVIFGVLIVEDLLAILLLVGLSTVVITKTAFSADMLLAVIKLILVVGAWFLVGYFLLPPIFRRLSTYISQETLTIVAVALCLFLVSIAAYFHYSTALGAFIMGSLLAETVLVHRIETLIVPIRDIFGAIFFISVGMLINPTVIMNQWQVVIFITVVLMLGKISVVTIGTLLTGQSVKTSIRSGFGMAQIGEFSFIIASLGVALHAINDTLYPIIVAVSSITTFTTPYMIRLSGHIGLKLENHMPQRVKFILDSYSNWIFRAQNKSGANSIVSAVTTRLFLNGITIAIIFTLINKFIFPEMMEIATNQRAKMICEAIAIVASSPFIWGMIFSYKSSIKTATAARSVHPIICVVWLITLIEIIVLSIVYFHTWATTAAFLAIVGAFFAIAYRQLEASYHWFESRLVKNISQPAKQSRYQELAPWDTHFVEIDIKDKSPFIGKMLSECQIRQLFGINIVAIHRGSRVMLAPRGEEKLQDSDKLIVLGNDEQIELFKKQAALSSSEHERIDRLEDFSLKAFLLDEGQPYINKTIRSSLIREKVKGLIVGIERGDNRILNPDPDMVLELNDLLLIVGESSNLKALLA